MSSSERQFALVELQQTFEVEEDSLSSFRPQIAAENETITIELRSTRQTLTYIICAHPSIYAHTEVSVKKIIKKKCL